MRNSRLGKLLLGLATLNTVLFWLWRRNRSAPPARQTAQPRGATVAASGSRPAATTAPSSSVARPSTLATTSVTTGAAKPARIVSASQRWATLGLLALALLLAIAGQSIFGEGQYSPNLSTGIGYYVVAIVLFSAAGYLSDRMQGDVPHSRFSSIRFDDLARAAQGALNETLQAIRSIRLDRRRINGLLIVAGLIAVLLNLLASPEPLPEYTLPFLMWLGAIGLYIRTMAPRPFRTPSAGMPWWQTERRIAIGLGIILLAAFFLRVWHVESIPPTVGGDEGSFGLEAVKTITGEWPNRNPFTTGWLSHPTLSFYFNSLTIRLFGQTVFGLRLAWALVGALTVLIVFHLARRLAGSMLALMTAGLLAAYHFHIHYSRLGVNNVADPLLVALVLLLLYRAVDKRSLLDWALCGVAVGVSQFFYFGARFTAIIVVVLVVYLAILGGMRFLREHARGVAIMVGASLISAAPMIQYAVLHPDDFNARFNQIGIIGASHWLENEVVVRDRDALFDLARQLPNAAVESELKQRIVNGLAGILLDQLQRAALAFNVYPDRTGWYGLARPGDGKIQELPLFDFVPGTLFLLGLGYATLRPFDRRLLPMVAWWWGAMILGGMLTESPPSTQRLVTLSVPAVFFVALALVKIGQIAQRAWNAWSPKRLVPYLGAAVLVLSLASVNEYFIEFTPLRKYGTFNGVVATEMAHYALDKLGPDWRIYFFGAPRMYHDFGTIPYIAPMVEGVDITEPLTASLDPNLVQPDKNAAFIFLPERQGELDFVKQTFPNGTLEEIPSFWEGDPNPFFVVYRVPLTQAP
ncbi:MAG TPA: glycosyltransferase family 39 protein [Anaerolineae bacterium]